MNKKNNDSDTLHLSLEYRTDDLNKVDLEVIIYAFSNDEMCSDIDLSKAYPEFVDNAIDWGMKYYPLSDSKSTLHAKIGIVEDLNSFLDLINHSKLDFKLHVTRLNM